MPLPNNDADFYLVIEGFGARGPSFLETDLAQADRDTIVRSFIPDNTKMPSGLSLSMSQKVGRVTCLRTSPARSSIAPTMPTRY
jgi:hypothetical protein